ncbi:MAG: hypothetical protein KAG10_07905, partial [Methylococcales bacterium]|nr:hypothetical protein [Methylococcales bacterium]
HLDLKSIDELQTAGIYLAVMKQVGNFKAEFQVTYFVVSDLGLHARMYHDKITVQISALATGNAVSGVEVTLYNEVDKPLAETKTDSEGQAHFGTHQDASYLLARDGNNLSVLKLNAPALDLSEFKIEGREQKPIELFIYSPRNLYRPGETITFSTILRNADAQLLPSPPIKAVIKRADGQKIKYFTWHPHLKEQGYYQTDYTLPETAMTGDWILELTIADKTTHQYKFKVEDFLPERMELLLGKQPAADNWTDSDSALTIPVSGRYLYGAPAAKNRLNSKVLIKKNRHPIKTLKDYYFGLEDEKPDTGLEELGDITLDAEGRINLNIDSVWGNVKHSP